MDPLEKALSEWREAIGTGQVLTARSFLASAETATFTTTQQVPAILRPGSREDVQACLRVAHANRVPLYPVSRGKNWGYGSRVPPRDGCALLDLGRMDRILDFDPRLAWVTVEPGVTFRRLQQYLAGRDAPLFMAATGSSPDASLIGTTLERGDGTGPLGDMFRHVCAMEVVLPTGECIHTGLARYPDALASPLHPWGAGPGLDGLFTQSSLGVVTRMTFWLSPLPGHFQLFLASIRSKDRLEPFVDALQGLGLKGVLTAPFYIWNDVKSLSLLRRYPWEAAGGRTPLPDEILEKFHRRRWGGLWTACGALYSPSARVGRAEKSLVRRALRDHADRLVFVTPLVSRLAGWIRAPYRWATGRDLQRIAHYRHRNPFLGWPIDRNLATAYWRKKAKFREMTDPDRDRCGFIWISVALPFRGVDLHRAEAAVLPLFRRHGFEPNLACIAVSPRCLYFLPAVIYDRDVPGEDQRAMACHDEILSGLIRLGYYPFRLGIQSMGSLPPAADDTDRLLAKLKDTLDPHHILSPGRYESKPTEDG
jgi:4-cresol dehydrogenase (hydroxylating)